MSGNPYYRRLDDDLFPELQFGPGRKGIRALMLQPLGDPRVPAPASARVLLAVFRLDRQTSTMQSPTGPQGWTLTFDRRDAEGRLHRVHLAVDLEPRDGNDSERALPDTGPPTQGQAIYRGAWWTDLADSYMSGVLRPGMAVEVGYAGLGHTRLILA